MAYHATRAAAIGLACCILGSLRGVAVARIAFYSNRHGTRDIHVIDHRGADLTRRTATATNESGPVWSPNGSQIAYTVSSNGNGAGWSGIWVVSATGPVSPQQRERAGALGLAWSPRGRRWATMRSKSNSATRYGVALIDSITGARRDLAPEMFLPGAAQLSWSPTADRIAVLSTIVDVATAEFHQWIQGATPGSLDWSQDGHHIAFQYGHHLNAEIYVATVDGSGIHKVVAHPSWDGSPSWSPDGREIAFTSNRDGNYEIYVVDVETGALRNLTRHPAEDRSPDWAPDIKLLSIFAKELTTWGWMKGLGPR